MIDRKNIPVVVECHADNGEHSHFKLIDVETGKCLWEESEWEESETAHNSDYARCLSLACKMVNEYDLDVCEQGLACFIQRHFA